MGSQQDRSLFNEEMSILESCTDDIASNNYSNSELLPKYKKLVDNYKKLLKFTKKVVKISDAQGKTLKDREYKIKSLLDNSNQGFLSFGKDLLVDEEYSVECIRIFDKKIKKDNIALLLSDNYEQQQYYTNAFSSAFREKSEERLKLLPTRININNRHIDVRYKLIDWLEEDYAILIILTDITEKIKTEAKVKYLSEHDSLTSLYNRFYIDKQIPQIITTANLPISIILADMNGLKLTNDVFGHQKGDELIVSVAKIFRTCCRAKDIIARWGGDEFLIILPATGPSDCQKIVEDINAACLEACRDVVDISFSIGTATMAGLNQNITDLFAVAESRMYKNKLLSQKTVRMNIVKKMATVLETRSIIPSGHIIRAKEIAGKFADLLGYGAESIEKNNLMLVATLHDVGKLAIPEDILKKPGPLTPREWEIVKNCSEIGYRMAQSIGEPGVAETILSLRESWDGTGYPNGLKGEQIPYLSRIFAIIDAFDLMTSDRVYRSAISQDEALAEIRSQSGLQFDPTLSNLFCSHFGFDIS